MVAELPCPAELMTWFSLISQHHTREDFQSTNLKGELLLSEDAGREARLWWSLWAWRPTVKAECLSFKVQIQSSRRDKVPSTVDISVTADRGGWDLPLSRES